MAISKIFRVLVGVVQKMATCYYVIFHNFSPQTEISTDKLLTYQEVVEQDWDSNDEGDEENISHNSMSESHLKGITMAMAAILGRKIHYNMAMEILSLKMDLKSRECM